ncbi:MAG: DUF87 domain-containing protein [Thermoplasmata archaeon]|nr:DUF87 domain-containing protein [Thermoplasmata archaeon]
MTTRSRKGEVVEEGAGWLRRGARFDAPLLVQTLPSEVPFGFLGRALPTSAPLELRMQLHRIDAHAAIEMLHSAHAVAEAELATGEGASGRRPPQLARESESAEELGRRVAAREQELWRVGIGLHALGQQRRRAERFRSELARRLSVLGFRTRVPEYESASALAPPDLTGQEARPSGYWHTLHTDGVAAFFPFVDETIAEPGGVLVGLLLEDASPVFLDRWRHASHSWGIFGTTGSGKSFATALTVTRSRWLRPELEVFILDPLGEFGGFARALGGSVLTVGAGSDVRWNPLDPASTGGDRAEKAARVGALLRTLFPSLADEEVAALDGAVSRLFRSGPEVPVLSDLARALKEGGSPPDRLLGLFDIFTDGSLSYLDGPTTASWGRSPVSIDLSGVSDAHRPFHLAYLFDAVYGRIRATNGPKLLVVDEAHLLAAHPATSAYFDRLVRHVRHFGAGVVVLSQNPDDFLSHESGRSLLRNLRATVLLRLPHVSPECREFFGLTDAESEWLPRARLPREAGYSEGLLRFGEAHLPIALVASTPEYEFLTRALGSPSPVPAAPVDPGGR